MMPEISPLPFKLLCISGAVALYTSLPPRILFIRWGVGGVGGSGGGSGGGLPISPIRKFEEARYPRR